MASLALSFDILARDKASGVFRHVGDAVDDTGRKAEGWGSRLAGFGTGILKIGAAAATAVGGVAVAGGIAGLKTASGMEQARISFETMLGSAEKADSFLKNLQKFAAKTPFEFPELQTAASSLVSVGIEAGDVIPIMTTLGDVTSGMGTGSEGVKRATVALQQMSAAGKITGEDLNQLRDAGVPVFDLLAAATGKTKEEVADLAAKGKLGKKELGQLFDALKTGNGLERFNGLMEKQSKSLSGVFSTLKDTVNMSLANLVAPAIPAITSGMTSISDGIASFMGGFTGTIDAGSSRAAQFGAQTKVVLQNLAGFVRDDVLPRLRDFAGFVQSDLLPRLRDFGGWIREKVIPPLAALVDHIKVGAVEAFNRIKAKFDENREGLGKLADTFRDIADFIATRVLPIVGPAAEFAFKQMAESIGRTIDVLGKLGPAFQFMWNIAKPVLDALISTWFTVVGGIVDGAARAFGWVPGLGGKLKQAAADFRDFRDQVNAALNGIHDKVVTLTYVTKGNAPGARSSGGGIIFEKAFASGGYMPAGGPYLVGENGPEAVWTSRPAYVSNASETASMLRSGGGGTPITVNVTVQGSVVGVDDLVAAVSSGVARRSASVARIGG